MATVQLDNINKVYENGYHTIHDLSLEIADKEFLVLVGPSGCRKVHGTADDRRSRDHLGRHDDDRRSGGQRGRAEGPRHRHGLPELRAVPPHDRVRQHRVRAQVGEGAEGRDRHRASARRPRSSKLEDNLNRKPGQLSGGQRQRVAMGRAIVRQPAAFLMDEPLSNLDAKLRVQMRAEIAALQRELGVTTVYVTHDQIEAMTMGDRVAVLKDGYLQQVDTPQNLYDHPVNVFVAAFIGSPSMNLFEADLHLSGDVGTVTLGSHVIAFSSECLVKAPRLRDYDDRRVIVGIRPEDYEDAAFAPRTPESQRITSTVALIEALGSEIMVHFNVDAAHRGLRRPGRGRGEGGSTPVERRRPVPPAIEGAHRRTDRDRDLDREHALLRHGDPPGQSRATTLRCRREIRGAELPRMPGSSTYTCAASTETSSEAVLDAMRSRPASRRSPRALRVRPAQHGGQSPQLTLTLCEADRFSDHSVARLRRRQHSTTDELPRQRHDVGTHAVVEDSYAERVEIRGGVLNLARPRAGTEGVLEGGHLCHGVIRDATSRTLPSSRSDVSVHDVSGVAQQIQSMRSRTGESHRDIHGRHDTSHRERSTSASTSTASAADPALRGEHHAVSAVPGDRRARFPRMSSTCRSRFRPGRSRTRRHSR